MSIDTTARQDDLSHTYRWNSMQFDRAFSQTYREEVLGQVQKAYAKHVSFMSSSSYEEFVRLKSQSELMALIRRFNVVKDGSDPLFYQATGVYRMDVNVLKRFAWQYLDLKVCQL